MKDLIETCVMFVIVLIISAGIYFIPKYYLDKEKTNINYEVNK